MKKTKFNNGLQLFDAPSGMTGTEDIDVTVREIDFVTSFANDLQHLMDILSITRAIEKPNGTMLKKKVVSGTLQSGEVGEGDLIPYSQYSVDEEDYAPIVLRKYKKGVSMEAVAEKGYEAAVADTDEEFKSDLRGVVTGDLYAQLEAGTLEKETDSFQAAIASAIGNVRHKFKTMHKTVTGVVVWVNTLDLYDYLGTADINVQTAFGMDYVEKFMGADIMFISSEIDSGKVYATAINNMVAYYVNPSNEEFKKMGLDFTVDSETGFIGFTATGNYDRMMGDSYAVLGLNLFAEYVDGIANMTFSEGPEPEPSSEKKILTFVIGDAEGTIDETDHTVAVTVPAGTTVTALEPVITISEKASVSPASGVATDFTSPVTYTVTAEDETTQAYTVTVTVADSTPGV